MDKNFTLRNARMLAQVSPNSADATTLYDPATGVKASIDNIVICNYSNAAVEVSLYHSDDGSAAGNANSLLASSVFAAYSTEFISFDNHGIVVNGDEGGIVYCKSNTANTITFTMYGVEITK